MTYYAHAWQLQTAKARFSELFRLVLEKGPQWVTRQGKEAVVIVPARDYEALTRRASPLESCPASQSGKH